MATANTKRTRRSDPNDLYNTEPLATLAAIRQSILPSTGMYWDPCDGLGGISDVLSGEGMQVYRSDLVVYPGREDLCHQKDFLRAKKLPPGVTQIIMNPPYRLNAEFIEKAASFNVPFFVFNRFNLLETPTRAEKMVSGKWPLKRVHLFPYRVGCTVGLDQKETAKAVCYCWFYFAPNHTGPVEFDFVLERPDAGKYVKAPDREQDVDDDLGL